MARRGAFGKTTIQVDGDDVVVKFRRHNAMDAVLESWDQHASQRDLVRVANEIDRLNELEKPTPEQAERVHEALKEMRANMEASVRFLHRNIISIKGLVHDNEDGGATPYDDCDEDKQLWLLYDCHEEFKGLVHLILNRQPKEGDPTPEKSTEPDSSTHSAECPE